MSKDPMPPTTARSGRRSRAALELPMRCSRMSALPGRSGAVKGRSMATRLGSRRSRPPVSSCRRTDRARRLRPAVEEAGLQVPDDGVEWMPTDDERSAPGRAECEEQRQAQPDHTRNTYDQQ